VGIHRSLAERRRMCGLTQHQMARETGIPIGRIVFAETGRTELTPAELTRIKSVLKQRVQLIAVAVGGS
jgi:DNA-binding XRE family transcriptional regulator